MAGNENIWFGLSKILEQKILDGEYTGRLPGIRKFSAALGVHPVTLIKALRNLEEKKLVVIPDRKGTFVVSSSLSSCVYANEKDLNVILNGISALVNKSRKNCHQWNET